MKHRLSLAVSPDAVCVDENGQPIPEPTREYFIEGLQAIRAHQAKCKADAVECLKFYFGDPRGISLDVLENWLAKNQPLDRWFFVHLIEVAGEKFLARSYSAHKAAIARSKNAVPRAWVLSEWASRPDIEQSKAAFGRVYAPLIKKQFRLIVNPETIARDWLPKNKS